MLTEIHEPQTMIPSTATRGPRRNRSTRLLGAALACLAVLVTLPELASGRSLARRPGRDPIQAPLINTDSLHGNAQWDNRQVRAQVRQQGCALSIDIRQAHDIANRDLVCLLGADSIQGNAQGGVSQVIAAEVDDRGRVKLRIDGRAENDCGELGDFIVYHTQMDCYLATVGTEPGEYDWQTACTDAGGFLLPPARVEAPAGGGLLGGCFGPVGSRITPPDAPHLATSGAFTRGD